ncbi:MAG: NYN domain-containing protein [Rhodothermales bacterium]
MRYSSRNTSTDLKKAVVFVDFDDLYRTLNPLVPQDAYPDDVVGEILSSTFKHVLEKARLTAGPALAYADFSEVRGNPVLTQRALAQLGIEPRFVPQEVQKNAAELQICIEATRYVAQEPNLAACVLITGERLYLPLAQYLRGQGLNVLVISLSAPPSLKAVQFVNGVQFIDALSLLSESTRRALSTTTSSVEQTPTEPEEAVAKVYTTVETPLAIQTIEVIEDSFGQYDEIYLTPLLRKLSDEFLDAEYDPKTIISELETAGAVALEKRKGFPYDYTVLILDYNHPDVQDIVEGMADPEEEEYDDWDEDDEAYQESEDERSLSDPEAYVEH